MLSDMRSSSRIRADGIKQVLVLVFFFFLTSGLSDWFLLKSGESLSIRFEY